MAINNPIDIAYLQVYFAELLLVRSGYEANKWAFISSIFYFEPLRIWQIGVAFYSSEAPTIKPRVKKRKLKFNTLKAQNADGCYNNIDEESLEEFDIAIVDMHVFALLKTSACHVWELLLKRFI